MLFIEKSENGGRHPRSLRDLTPFTALYDKPPREYTKKEAKVNFEYLLSELPKRVQYFKGVLADDGVQVEGAPEKVLTAASEWIIARGKVVSVRSGIPSFMKTLDSEKDIDLATKSACCYFGYWFSDYIFKEMPELEWRVSREKRGLDLNLPIIYTPHGPCTIEPTGASIGFISRRMIDKAYSEPYSEMYLRSTRILRGDFSEFL